MAVQLRLVELGAYISGMETDKEGKTMTDTHDIDHRGILLLTYVQVAKRLNVSRTTVYLLIAEGKLKPVHIGRSARITAGELDRFVDEL